MHACLVTQSCPTLCDSMDCSPPGSSVHGILQARVLEWVVFPSPGIFLTQGSNLGPLQTGSLPSEAPGKPLRRHAWWAVPVLRGMKQGT